MAPALTQVYCPGKRGKGHVPGSGCCDTVKRPKSLIKSKYQQYKLDKSRLEAKTKLEEESGLDKNVELVTKATSAVTVEESVPAVANGEAKETPTSNGSSAPATEANGVVKVPPSLNSKGSSSASLDATKEQFLNLCKSLDPESNKQFMAWLADEALPYLKDIVPELEKEEAKLDAEGADEAEEEECCEPDERFQNLDRISTYLRDREDLPVDATYPSECIRHPTSGDDAGLTAENCVHVDSFLYDVDDEEMLVEEGLLSRAYCLDCGSRNTKDLTYITHSCSKERLQYIFEDLLPDLKGKTVVDVGSRLGAVLYGAYYFSEASKIVGIEINKDFCKLQEDTVAKFKLKDRVKIVLGNMCAQTELLKSADVIVLNNVFSWFMPEQLQAKMWQCLHRVIRPGCLLVTIPALEDSLTPLKTGIKIESWVKQMDGYEPTGEDDEQMELSEIKLYEVLPKSS